ncbi:MAG: isoleucine--tRNA ligase [Dehalococcoidia bacterium]|nr:isoleucine--tRNA ligase [Dehalococcoidia bacterium]
MFRKVSSKANFPRIEQDILRFWKEQGISDKSIEARRGNQHYVFYEGPPTANGSPGIHHVLSRLFKDIICRYKTMKGYHVPRKAGWDTHGLPVELEVESSLGFSNKAQIEQYGVAQFNQKCRESVFNYIKEWEAMTERIGHWLDMKHPYTTLDNGYIESCWWIVKKLWDKGLIYQGYKVTPHCPRCGTSLSSHEVALGYRDDAEDPSVYIKFKLFIPSLLKRDSVLRSILKPAALGEKPAYFLAWTTTPWTLPGNTALAVAPGAEYSVMEGEQDYLILAMQLTGRVKLEGYKEAGVILGEDLAHLQYEPLFNPHDFGVHRVSLPSLYVQEARKDLTYPVISADFVSLEEGTGIVHIAPAFGEVDFDAGMDRGLDFVQPVDLEGKVTGTYLFAGKFVKDADPLILDDLKSHDLLYLSERIIHTYPFCWRCETALLYYAKKAWYIRTTAAKDRLISGNAEINWYPSHIKYGRFGDWLENNVDWAFSRERYWGTPLNIWCCSSCGNYECVGSVDELKAMPNLRGLDEPLDLHRPFVDRITFNCSWCGGDMRRIPEVIDCWFDSGAMPVAQWHYPFENRDKFEQNFPADFICEAVDQTRGWFYSLHAISTLLFEQPCFKNVICLGHVVDAQGEKMSKAKGNVIDPWTVVNDYGADVLRWYLLASGPAENIHRFSTQMVAETMRKVLLTLWNTYSFFVLYANIDRFVPQPSVPAIFAELDNWIISELNRLVAEVTKVLDSYDPTSAARYIQSFIDDLSNWYVRRSRRRFWKSENDADKLAAYTTLYQCLVTLSQLLAPFIPFISEELYQNLVCSINPEAKESVHLTDFPVADKAKINDKLDSDVRLAMKIASLGRAARAKVGIKVRQPLAKAMVKVESEEEGEALGKLATEIEEEINVKELVILSPSLPVIPSEAKNLEEFSLDLPGYSIASDGRYTVAISTELTPELAAEGISREIVRRLQNMRRAANFDVADYIASYYQAEESIERVIAAFGDYIKLETLSRELIAGFPPNGAYTEKYRISNSDVLLAIKRSPEPFAPCHSEGAK